MITTLHNRGGERDVREGIPLLLAALLICSAQGSTTKTAANYSHALFARPFGTMDWHYVCAATPIRQNGDSVDFLTARHCLDPHTSYAIAPDEGPSWFLPARITGVAANADMAQLTVESPELLGVVPIPLGKDPEMGDAVELSGWPDGHDKTILHGSVKATPTIESFELWPIETEEAIRKGMSGSPVLCGGRVALCGILTGTAYHNPTMGYIEPVSALQGRWLQEAP